MVEAVLTDDGLGADSELGGKITGITFLVMGVPALLLGLWGVIKGRLTGRDESPTGASTGVLGSSGGMLRHFVGFRRRGHDRADRAPPEAARDRRDHRRRVRPREVEDPRRAVVPGHPSLPGPGGDAAAARLRRVAAKLEADIAVVGAGIAGLSRRGRWAAGRSVAVLEARDRVGGRTLNMRSGTARSVEIGGQWVGPTQDRSWRSATSSGSRPSPPTTRAATCSSSAGKRKHYKGTIPRIWRRWCSRHPARARPRPARRERPARGALEGAASGGARRDHARRLARRQRPQPSAPAACSRSPAAPRGGGARPDLAALGAHMRQRGRRLRRHDRHSRAAPSRTASSAARRRSASRSPTTSPTRGAELAGAPRSSRTGRRSRSTGQRRRVRARRAIVAMAPRSPRGSRSRRRSPAAATSCSNAWPTAP